MAWEDTLRTLREFDVNDIDFENIGSWPAGIKAILNFSPGALKVPGDVKLKGVDLTVSLESLSFYLAQGGETRG